MLLPPGWQFVCCWGFGGNTFSLPIITAVVPVESINYEYVRPQQLDGLENFLTNKFDCFQINRPVKSLSRDQTGNTRIPRSASIDSMVEAVWNTSPRASITVDPPSELAVPSFPNSGGGCSTTPGQSCSEPSSATIGSQQRASQQLHINCAEMVIRRESLLSPSAGRRSKQHRSITCEYTNTRNVE